MTWQEVIDQLGKWASDPSVLDDDGSTAPSMVSLWRARDLAKLMNVWGAPSPLRVIPDGEGGVSFERRELNEFLSLDVAEGGDIELAVFDKDCKLAGRVRLEPTQGSGGG